MRQRAASQVPGEPCAVSPLPALEPEPEAVYLMDLEVSGGSSDTSEARPDAVIASYNLPGQVFQMISKPRRSDVDANTFKSNIVGPRLD